MRLQWRLVALVSAVLVLFVPSACTDAQRRAVCNALPNECSSGGVPNPRGASPVPVPACTQSIRPGTSISHAEGALAPGAVLCLHGGIYHEKVTLRAGGTAQKPVFVRAAPGETPVIDGSGVTVHHNDGLFNIDAGANYLVVDGLTIQHSASRGLVNDASNVTVQRSKILFSADAGIMTTNWSGPATNDVYVANEIAYNVASNDCKTPTDPCHNSGGWESATNFYAAGSNLYGPVVFRGNNIHDNDGEGMVLGDGDQVIGNVVHDNYGFNIYLDGTEHALIDSNVVYERETSYLPYSGNESYRLLARGIGLADESGAGRNAYNTIRNNFILGTREGIEFWNTGARGTGMRGDAIDNNTIVNTWEPGIDLQAGAHSGTMVRDNIVVPRSGTPTDGLNAPGITLQANIFTNRGGPNDPRLPAEAAPSVDPKHAMPPAGSIAIDHGVSTSAKLDYFGVGRPAGKAYDIGASERH